MDRKEPTREKDIERYMVQEIKKLGGRAYKFTSPGNSGVPDRIVILPKVRPIFVELKSDYGKLSRIQEVQINRLRELGQDVRVLYGADEVKAFLKGCCHHINGDKRDSNPESLMVSSRQPEHARRHAEHRGGDAK